MLGLQRPWSIGDGSNSNRNLLVNVTGLSAGVSAIVASAHTCALLDPGGIKCWGLNGSGQLGDGTLTNRSTPIDVPGLLSGIKAIAAGNTHTCAVTTAGSIKCWGSNGSGQLGDGTTSD